MARRASKCRSTLFNRDPNEIKYKGRKGMTCQVVWEHISHVPSETWEWRMRYFDTDDKLNGELEQMRMEMLIQKGWQRVSDSTVAHWELVEKNGERVGTTEGFSKLF